MAAGYAAGRLAFVGRAALPAIAFFGCAAATVLVRALGTAALALAGSHPSLGALVPGAVAVAYTSVLAPPLLALLDGRVGARRRRTQPQV